MKKFKRFLVYDPRAAFYVISAAGILLYFLLSLRYGNDLYRWMVQENKPDLRFCDYFYHFALTADRRNLYQQISWDAAGCFPPLAYCLYWAVYKLTAVPGYRLQGWAATEKIPGALSVFTYVLIFTALLFFLAIGITGRKNRKKDVLIFTLLMLSAVFLGSGYMTGNSTMLVLAVLIAALRLRESDVPLRRELALVLLAFCVAMKLYPAVFGLLYLKDRRYKELLRLILYSFVLLFAPFAFFGGITGLKAWLKHIMTTMHYTDYARPQYLMGIFHTLLKRFAGVADKRISAGLSVLVCLVWTLLAWRSRSRIRTVFFLICIMVFFPANAYRYSLSYFTIPLVAFLKADGPEDNWHFTVAMILYGLLFTIPVWWLAVIPMTRTYRYYTLTPVEIYLYLTAYALIGTMMIAEGQDMILRKKEGRLK